MKLFLKVVYHIVLVLSFIRNMHLVIGDPSPPPPQPDGGEVKKTRRCRVCDSTEGHDRRNCPNKHLYLKTQAKTADTDRHSERS